jgi:hypothetical protein
VSAVAVLSGLALLVAAMAAALTTVVDQRVDTYAQSPRTPSVSEAEAAAEAEANLGNALVRQALAESTSCRQHVMQPATARLRGQVRLATGAPAGGAEIWLAPTGCAGCGFHAGKCGPAAHADANGEFELALPRAEEQTLMVRLAGQLDHVVQLARCDHDDESITVCLRPGFAVHSTVMVRPGDVPLAGARVSVALLNASGSGIDLQAGVDAVVFPRCGLTGENGSFQLDGLAHDRYLLRIEHPDWPTLEHDFVLEASGCSLPARIAIASGSVTGFLLRQGRPRATARIAAANGRGPMRDVTTTTALDGHFVMHGLCPGRLRIVAAEEGAAWSVEVVAGETVEVRLELPESTPIDLTGTARTATGRIARGSFTFSPAFGSGSQCISDPICAEVMDGRWRATVPSAGTYSYRLAWLEGARWHEHRGDLVVREGTRDLEIIIPSGELRVWLVEDGTGNPMRLPIRLLRDGAGVHEVVVHEPSDATVPDAAGLVTFANLAPGDYFATCAAESSSPAKRSPTVRVPDGAGVVDLVFLVQD